MSGPPARAPPRRTRPDGAHPNAPHLSLHAPRSRLPPPRATHPPFVLQRLPPTASVTPTLHRRVNAQPLDSAQGLMPRCSAPRTLPQAGAAAAAPAAAAAGALPQVLQLLLPRLLALQAQAGQGPNPGGWRSPSGPATLPRRLARAWEQRARGGWSGPLATPLRRHRPRPRRAAPPPTGARAAAACARPSRPAWWRRRRGRRALAAHNAQQTAARQPMLGADAFKCNVPSLLFTSLPLGSQPLPSSWS